MREIFTRKFFSEPQTLLISQELIDADKILRDALTGDQIKQLGRIADRAAERLFAEPDPDWATTLTTSTDCPTPAAVTRDQLLQTIRAFKAKCPDPLFERIVMTQDQYDRLAEYQQRHPGPSTGRPFDTLTGITFHVEPDAVAVSARAWELKSQGVSVCLIVDEKPDEHRSFDSLCPCEVCLEARHPPELREACQKCKMKPANDLHACPYAQDIGGDVNALCDCCDDCCNECAHDV